MSEKQHVLEAVSAGSLYEPIARQWTGCVVRQVHRRAISPSRLNNEGVTYIFVAAAGSQNLCFLTLTSATMAPKEGELSAAAQQELKCALADVLEFRPEPEEITDNDLERNRPSYSFPD